MAGAIGPQLRLSLVPSIVTGVITLSWVGQHVGGVGFAVQREMRSVCMTLGAVFRVACQHLALARTVLAAIGDVPQGAGFAYSFRCARATTRRTRDVVDACSERPRSARRRTTLWA